MAIPTPRPNETTYDPVTDRLRMYRHPEETRSLLELGRMQYAARRPFSMPTYSMMLTPPDNRPSRHFATEAFVRVPELANYARSMRGWLDRDIAAQRNLSDQLASIYRGLGGIAERYRPAMLGAIGEYERALRSASGELAQWSSPQALTSRLGPLISQYASGQAGVQGSVNAAIQDYINQLQSAQRARESFAQQTIKDLADRAQQTAIANAMRSVNIIGAGQGTGGASSSLAALAARSATEAALPYQSRWAETMLNVLGGRGAVAEAGFGARRYGLERESTLLGDIYGKQAGLVQLAASLAPQYIATQLGYSQLLSGLPARRLQTELGLQDILRQSVQGQQDAMQDAYDRALANIAAWSQLRSLGIEDVVYPREPQYIGIPWSFA